MTIFFIAALIANVVCTVISARLFVLWGSLPCLATAMGNCAASFLMAAALAFLR